MELMLDIGNTNVAYAFLDQGQLIKGSFVKNTTPLDELIAKIKLINQFDFNEFKTLIVASVVPKYTLIFKKYAAKHNLKLLEVGKVKSGINIKVAHPKEVGADLIATAAGVDQQFNSLIFDFGTALTATFLAQNTFLGCNITLGLGQIVKQLDFATALLFQTSIEKVVKAVGTTTATAINIGVYQTCKGFIKENIIVAKKMWPNFKVYFTGNDAEVFRKDFKEYHFVEALIFKGLAHIYELNK